MPIPETDEPADDVDMRQQQERVVVHLALTHWLQRLNRHCIILKIISSRNASAGLIFVFSLLKLLIVKFIMYSIKANVFGLFQEVYNIPSC